MEERTSSLNNTANAPPSPPPVDAKASLSVTYDTLRATIKISRPLNGGADLSYDALKELLEQRGIVFGINDSALKLLANKPIYNSDIVIATGVNSKRGIDAEIVYYVDTDRQLKPQEREDGSIDFKELGIIQEVKKDTLLCEKKPLTEGTPGTGVTGNVIPAIPGKDKSMPAGKNTVLSEDKLKLLAAEEGQVSIIEGKINILNTFTVRGNVSIETGNINFSGNVIVKGDVTAGFSVQAAGDVTVDGIVESARIVAGGSLIIRGGFRGSENGTLDAGANVACRFIEGGIITVRGNLETTYIMSATVKCGGDINLTGRGMIRSSYVMARTSITAKYIGNDRTSVSNTTIEVGNDPVVLERFKVLSSEIESYEKNISNLELLISSLSKMKEAGTLSSENADKLKKAKLYIESLRSSYLAMSEEHEMLKAQISEIGYGTINVSRTAYPGLKIVIGHDMIVLQNEYSYTTFYRNNDGITFSSLR